MKRLLVHDPLIVYAFLLEHVFNHHACKSSMPSQDVINIHRRGSSKSQCAEEDMVKSSKAFILQRRRLNYMIWHRDCVHTHHHTEIQVGFEVLQKNPHQRRNCIMMYLLYLGHT